MCEKCIAQAERLGMTKTPDGGVKLGAESAATLDRALAFVARVKDLSTVEYGALLKQMPPEEVTATAKALEALVAYATTGAEALHTVAALGALFGGIQAAQRTAQLN